METTFNWLEAHPAKLATAETAVAKIQRGRRIFIGSGAAEPTGLVDALVRHEGLLDNEIVHLLTLGPAPYVAPALERRFRHTAFFIGANVREAVQSGRADFMPVFLSEIPSLITSGRVRIDVALIQVSPPDRHGYVSLGVSVDVVRAAVASARMVIAEVNPLMPRTHGNSFIHVSEIDRLVPIEKPLPELAVEPLDDVCREIGRQVATLIPDGATLQTGIGRIPHAVLSSLHGHHDLGVHTEMLSDSVIDLVEAGVINGRRKTLLPGKLVTSFVMGTRRLYDWVNENPSVQLEPSDFTNDPFTIAKNDCMVAINSALAVDLTGQVASDTLMGKFFSGIGGQVDFVRGAARSRGGKPIIALPSTANGGGISRIQAAFEQGAGVVTSRGDVHYVVTEYGIADLWGKSVRERALSLIEIAHPDHRAELLSAAKARLYVFPDQKVAGVAAAAVHETIFTTANSIRVCIRPMKASDEESLQDLLYALSEESTRSGFFMLKRAHPHEELLGLLHAEDDRGLTLVAVPSEAGSVPVGFARFEVTPATDSAEVAFIVADDWQGRGIGTALLAKAIEIARARGIASLTADVLASNARMLQVFHKSGLKMESRLAAGVYSIRLQLG